MPQRRAAPCVRWRMSMASTTRSSTRLSTFTRWRWATPRRCSLPAMRTLVLQHIACEPPGAFEDVLLERGAKLHRVELDEGQPLPDWLGFDTIVAMGGPMSVNDEAEHPWPVGEKRLIREAVGAGVAFWGACL